MPSYTIKSFNDIDTPNPNPDRDAKFARSHIDSEHVGVSYFRYGPNFRGTGGHSHREQEEVYVVVGGGGRMAVDDEVVELRQWDAVRVPPGSWRGYEAGPQGLEILVFGAPDLGENPREDVEGRRGWWAD